MKNDGLSLMLDRYRAVRQQTLSLIEGLSAEDCCVQSMAETSPVKWHLAHTTWFFETFVLEIYEHGFKPFQSEFRMLFNSYYETVGPKHPRPKRGLMTRPSLKEIVEYRSHVDERIERLLSSSSTVRYDLNIRMEWGMQHEQQHQELILSDLKHLFFQNPLRPSFRPLSTNVQASSDRRASSQAQPWDFHPGGLVEIGAAEDAFCFDNEQPRHSYWLEPFKLSSSLVTNQDFKDFIDDGGYENPRLWLADGWTECERQLLQHPQYWQRTSEGWFEFTLQGNQPLDPLRPLLHVSYFEADAFARWAGYRLPSEFEWESMVRTQRLDRAEGFITGGEAIKLHPDPEDISGFTGFFRSGWQWTQSSYAAYPGYRPMEGALGEYNGKFMVNQQVLRGGACTTPLSHVRASYRNFYPADSRWVFSSIRLALST